MRRFSFVCFRKQKISHTMLCASFKSSFRKRRDVCVGNRTLPVNGDFERLKWIPNRLHPCYYSDEDSGGDCVDSVGDRESVRDGAALSESQGFDIEEFVSRSLQSDASSLLNSEVKLECVSKELIREALVEMHSVSHNASEVVNVISDDAVDDDITGGVAQCIDMNGVNSDESVADITRVSVPTIVVSAPGSTSGKESVYSLVYDDVVVDNKSSIVLSQSESSVYDMLQSTDDMVSRRDAITSVVRVISLHNTRMIA